MGCSDTRSSSHYDYTKACLFYTIITILVLTVISARVAIRTALPCDNLVNLISFPRWAFIACSTSARSCLVCERLYCKKLPIIGMQIWHSHNYSGRKCKRCCRTGSLITGRESLLLYTIAVKSKSNLVVGSLFYVVNSLTC